MKTWVNEFENMVQEANCAPNVHNVQPALWRKTESGIELYLNQASLIPVADPTGRDIEISLGAAIEGLHLAASSRGLQIKMTYYGLWEKPVASFQFEKLKNTESHDNSENEIDPLCAYISTRQSFRGLFAASNKTDKENLIRILCDQPDVHLLVSSEDIALSARLYDQANYGFLKNPEFLRELYKWLRFQSSHDNYDKDGLNRAAMNLDPVSAFFAAKILQPEVFRYVDRIGLGRALTSEAKAILSSTAVLLLTRPKAQAPSETGRRLYRLWLTVEMCGFAACPMSSLIDDPVTRSAITPRIRIPPESEIYMALRCGPKPSTSYKRARKPTNELLIQE